MSAKGPHSVCAHCEHIVSIMGKAHSLLARKGNPRFAVNQERITQRIRSLADTPLPNKSDIWREETTGMDATSDSEELSSEPLGATP